MEENDTPRDKELFKIEKEFNDVVNSLEGFEVTNNSLHASSGIGEGASFLAGFYKNNYSLQNTKYYLEGTTKTVHFTSYQVLLSILNYRNIRLYNLVNSNDSEEYLYAAKKLNLDDIRKHRARKDCFTFSMCSEVEKANRTMWKNYTLPNLGVALGFEIKNNTSNWKNFYFTKIRYGELEEIESFNIRLNHLKEKYSNCVFDVQLDHLMAFHKEKKNRWVNERELRILGVYPYTSPEREYIVHKDFKVNTDGYREPEYIELPLWIDSDFLKNINLQDPLVLKNNGIAEKMPVLKLTTITFKEDFLFKNNNRINFKQELERFMLFRLGYKVNVEFINVE